ncbi:MAG: hypothetical protein AB7O59_20945 [Pirellulales bacterium]
MNCDQVFDVLTRGPFPTGTACDTPVEAHLRVCPECRRLAEALRPALELFQEAVSPEESRDLPGYWCSVGAERSQPLVSYAKEVEPSRPAVRPLPPVTVTKSFSAASAWGLAAALALGVTLGSMLSTRWSLDGFSAMPPRETGGVIVRAADDDGPRFTASEHKLLAALPAAACNRHQPKPAPRHTVGNQQVLSTAELGQMACCTECHNANSDSVPDFATATVRQSCQICHKDHPPHSLE